MSQLVVASAWAVKPVLLAQTLGWSTIVLPYQAPHRFWRWRWPAPGEGTPMRYCVGTAALSLVTVIPLNLVWWWLLGVV